ncbi:hypothetical protein AQUCO_06600032v1 [Aquilegia coerulea]|uniref:Uncharacterized protein n=1 Tax=Aquilegia coerulea TaxID=218851 RepID=A0A2G5CC46_AQUCA|nr:hypothetical protein AQUCO_06600032v1 [Aquilegia coerulea]
MKNSLRSNLRNGSVIQRYLHFVDSNGVFLITCLVSKKERMRRRIGSGKLLNRSSLTSSTTSMIFSCIYLLPARVL